MVSEKTVKIFISGRVQGVGFRYYTRQCAKDLGLTGWVRNLSDGEVETVARGKEDQLEKLISKLKNGPTAARVDEIMFADVSAEEIQKIETIKEFSIAR